MTFSCNRKQLANELGLLSTIAERKTTMPVLATVLCRLSNGLLTLTATDLDVYIISELSAAGEPWAGCIPLDQFKNFARLAESETLDFTEKDNRIQIKAGRSKCALPITSVDQFPAKPELSGEAKLVVAGEPFRKDLARVLPCVSDEESRYAMRGVKFEAKDGTLKMVATDGHRLGVTSIAVKGEIDTLVPPPGLEALLQTDSESIEIRVNENHVSFTCGSRLIISRLIHGQFPQWQLIVPKDLSYQAEFASGELASALRRASLTRTEVYKTGTGKILGGVTMIFERELITVDTGVSDRGRSEEPVTAISNLNGDAVTVGINPDYVADFLRDANDKVKCEFKDASSVLRLTDGSAFECVIAPMYI